MPLHEPPLQRCGTGHWLSEPCPKGECDLLVFEKDRMKLKRSDIRVKSGTISDQVAATAANLVVEPEPEMTPDGPVKPMTPAEKQKLWRQKNAEKVREADRLRKAEQRRKS